LNTTYSNNERSHGGVAVQLHIPALNLIKYSLLQVLASETKLYESSIYSNSERGDGGVTVQLHVLPFAVEERQQLISQLVFADTLEKDGKVRQGIESE
jgi:hypothetical protein